MNIKNTASGGVSLAKNKDTDIKLKTSIGGQALIEGIMMRGPKKSAMAVRNIKGEIVIEEWDNAAKRGKFARLPFVRGIFGFIDSMKIGYKCLMRSAELSGLGELPDDDNDKDNNNKEISADITADTSNGETALSVNETEKKAVDTGIEKEHSEVIENTADSGISENIKNPENTVKDRDKVNTNENGNNDKNENENKNEEKKDGSAIMTVAMVIGTVLGLALAIGLFLVMPSYLFKWLSSAAPALKPENNVLASLYKSVFEGLLRVVILVAYMAVVSLMKDIRRTFEYHGAEHKTIFCYEKGLELTVDNVRKQRRFHPRCGTSFLILMVLVGIFISFLIDPLCILISGGVPSTFIRVIIKLCLIPVIMGVGYELLKLAGRHDNVFTRIISAPGMWLQHITVHEPDDSMIECAIAAVKKVIPDDGSDKW